ncbi:MAG: hypothetical protein FWD64_00990 [Acidobacteriaceae bacterium]|nr:hypothetical protein [Acidobacteriaceae bacterium]
MLYAIRRVRDCILRFDGRARPRIFITRVALEIEKKRSARRNFEVIFSHENAVVEPFRIFSPCVVQLRFFAKKRDIIRAKINCVW